ncbi:putative protein kinase RLK-Pelle-RLCK-VIIa-2 family [Helianthus annuus]|nr:putative protein kinase RLK-Pelle-RLCK-VIIa-2 family [Helianthus annuus]
MPQEDNGEQKSSASTSSLDKRIMPQEDNGEQKSSALSTSLDIRSMHEEDDGERKDPSLSSSSLHKQCQVFSLAEIKLATNDFDDAFVIGKGGFGQVYKGKIDFGASTDVAIKRLDCNSNQGETEFYAEIEMLSKIRHRSVISDRKTGSHDSGGIATASQRVVSPSEDATPLIFKEFTYSDLQKATCNFRRDCFLGEGGFGKVFKGWLDRVTYTPQKAGKGLPVAIKKLNPETIQGFEEWQTEVTLLGRLKHPNVVKLFIRYIYLYIYIYIIT